MEPNLYKETNVHELYPGAKTGMKEREGWGVMFERLSTDMKNLWERQSSLIGAEMNEKLTVMKIASTSLVTGGVILLVGVMCLAATAIIALSNVVDPWVAAGIVTVILLLIGFVMVKGAQKKIAGRGLVPDQSIGALKEIKNSFQERIHEFKRQ